MVCGCLQSNSGRGLTARELRVTEAALVVPALALDLFERTSRSSSWVYTGRSSPVAASRARATVQPAGQGAATGRAGAAAISRPW
jgi:hypothetical protein